MEFINKIKEFFLAAKRNADEKFDNAQKEEGPGFPQPKGELIGQCALCSLAIGSEDKIRDFNGYKAHKRCVKKAIKAQLGGQNAESIFSNERR